MVRAAGINKRNGATLDLIDTYDRDVPTGLQLMVKTPSELEQCLLGLETMANSNNGDNEYVHFKNIKAIDLNFGCPSQEIIREGGGPALLKRKKRLSEIFSVLASWRDNNSLGIMGR